MRVVAAVVAVSAALYVRAQDSDQLSTDESLLACAADEQGQWDWMDNGADQTPCMMANTLMGACGSDLETLSPPTEETHNDCVCSMVTFVLVQACTACRNDDTTTSWYDWRLACANTTEDGFPRELPDDTTIPHWAFYDVTAYNAGGYFSKDTAKFVYSSDPALSILAASSTANSQSSSTVASAASSSSLSNTTIGAIVGGVVGGVVLLSVVLIGLLIWRRHKKERHVAPSAAYMAECGCRDGLPPLTPVPGQRSRRCSYSSVSQFPEKEKLRRHYSDVSKGVGDLELFLPPLRPNPAHYSSSPRGSVSSVEYSDVPQPVRRYS